MPLSNSDNLLIRLIIDGRIKNEEDLKKAWRLMARETHPDSSGNPDDSSPERFLRLSDWYDEALDYLKDIKPSYQVKNWEREFYLCLKELEDLELPYNKTQRNQARRIKLETELSRYLINWLGDENDSYQKGLEEYILLKNETRPNDQEHIYRPGFYGLIKILLYNLTSFQFTGKSLYQRQFHKHMKTVEEDRDGQNYLNLIRLLHILAPRDPRE